MLEGISEKLMVNANWSYISAAFLKSFFKKLKGFILSWFQESLGLFWPEYRSFFFWADGTFFALPEVEWFRKMNIPKARKTSKAYRNRRILSSAAASVIHITPWTNKVTKEIFAEVEHQRATLSASAQFVQCCHLLWTWLSSRVFLWHYRLKWLWTITVTNLWENQSLSFKKVSSTSAKLLTTKAASNRFMNSPDCEEETLYFHLDTKHYII